MAAGWRAFHGRDGGACASPRPDDRDRRHRELGDSYDARTRAGGTRWSDDDYDDARTRAGGTRWSDDDYDDDSGDR